MIIIDLNQIMIATLMVLAAGKQKKQERLDMIADEDFLRHMVLNVIRANNVKFREQFGQLVVASDDTRSWRKQYFPFYKAHRRKQRDQSEFDWGIIFKSFQKIRDEMAENMQFPVVSIPGAEADDVIGTLVAGHKGPVLILSGDKDFVQLQKYPEIKQYDPIRKRWLTTDNPYDFLIDHVINGDRGDGIPNIFSGDDVFVTDARQAKVTEKRRTGVFKQIVDGEFESQTIERNYFRNRTLIDLAQTPVELQQEILAAYKQQCGKDKSKIFNYFVSSRLTNLIECIGEF